MAGEYQEEDQMQWCILCGEVITDNRGVSVMIKPDGLATALCGFLAGPVFRRGNVTGKGEDPGLPYCTTRQ